MSVSEMPTKAAVYVRLSKEDRNKVNKDDDSESIINQQTMLLDYCRQHGWEVYDVYNDEDFSGSDRERPDFNRMIADARDHRFDTILCKTQSRFARDMEIIEKYINGLFPIWGIRFISVIDNHDSDNKSNKKARQINSLIDQWYLEDLSENVRATLAAKRKQGLWVGAFAPFGYIKDPENRNRLIVDEEAAAIVKYVFSLYLQGFGITAVARRLNEEKIPNPATYKQQHGQPFQNINGQCSAIWHAYTVQRMLSNQVYIGNTVQGTCENISYKSSKKRRKPREEWDIVAHTHEPIIDADTFEQVQRLRKSKPKCSRTGKPNLFAAKVRCLKCGGSMRVYYTHRQRFFRCATAYFAKHRCEGTFVSENVLQREVLRQIRSLFAAYVDEEPVMKAACLHRSPTAEQAFLQQRLHRLEQDIAKIDARLKAVYLDKLDGVITAQDYPDIKREFQTEREALVRAKNRLSEEMAAAAKETAPSDSIEKWKDLQEPDYLTISTLIDYLEVGGDKNNRIIHIHWNI